MDVDFNYMLLRKTTLPHKPDNQVLSLLMWRAENQVWRFKQPEKNNPLLTKANHNRGKVLK